MSYRLDLDEYTEVALLKELFDRAASRSKGNCDYCNRPSDTTSCKFPIRHALAALYALERK